MNFKSCSFPSISPNFLSQITDFVVSEHSSQPCTPEATIMGTLYSPNSGSQVAINCDNSITETSPASHFLDIDWLPDSGSRHDPVTGFTWTKYDFKFSIVGNTLFEKYFPNKKSNFEMHPNLGHFRLLSESNSHHDDEDQIAEMLMKDS